MNIWYAHTDSQNLCYCQAFAIKRKAGNIRGVLQNPTKKVVLTELLKEKPADLALSRLL